MKLVEIRCKNCGSILKIDDEDKSVTCEYCHTTFVIDDEVQHIQYDNMYESGYQFEKGRIEANKENTETSFNDAFEIYSGTISSLAMERINWLLDNVVKNNKKNEEQQITVVYKKIATANPDEIIELKRKLKSKTHEVILDYDENDQVNKVTIKEVNASLGAKLLWTLIILAMITCTVLLCYPFVKEIVKFRF